VKQKYGVLFLTQNVHIKRIISKKLQEFFTNNKLYDK